MGRKKGITTDFNGPSNLFDLRSKVKKAPRAYKNDVLRQLNHWQATLKLLKISNTMNTTRSRTKELAATIEFLSHVIHKYPNEPQCQQFPMDLLSLLDQHVETLNTFVRKIIIKSLCLLESNNCIAGIKILPLYFRLLSLSDKTLRYLVYSSIVQIITRVNKRSKNQELNRSIQNYMFNMLRDESDLAVKKCLSVLIELYRRNVWRTRKIMNLISDLCLHHSNPSILRQALHFMLGHRLSAVELDSLEDSLDSSLKSETELSQLNSKLRQSHIQKMKFNTKRAKQKLLRIAKIEDELESRLQSGGKASDLLETDANGAIDLLPIRSLYDAQKFAETLFKRLKGGSSGNRKIAWDVRLLMLDLLSKCVSCHELFLFQMYNFCVRWLRPHQKNVTQVIAYVAQGVHKLVPPEVLEPVIKHLAQEFVGQFSDDESIAVGINAIRWICKRQPLVMHEGNRELLWDLCMFEKHRKDRGVQMAARGLIQLYRVENPLLLQRKDRGKIGAQMGREHEKIGGMEHVTYGQREVLKDIRGADLLAQEDAMIAAQEAEEEAMNAMGDMSDDDLDAMNQNSGNKVTRKELDFLEVEESDSEELGCLEVVDSDDADDEQMNGMNAKEGKEENDVEMEKKEKEEKRRLLVTRILSDSDLERLRELRVKNLMQQWNRKRDEVGLKEDEESDHEVDPSNIESLTTQMKRRKEQRKYDGKHRKSSKMTWDQYTKAKGGGSTNLEKVRNKPFHMTKYGKSVLNKNNRSRSLKNTIARDHRRRVKREGKHGKRRRR